jgi:lipid A 4'-phosphatase
MKHFDTKICRAEMLGHSRPDLEPREQVIGSQLLSIGETWMLILTWLRRAPAARGLPQDSVDWGLRLASVALAAGSAAALIHMLWPRLDIAVASQLFGSNGEFRGQRSLAVSAMRFFFIGAFAMCSSLSVLGMLVSGYRRQSWLGIPFTGWMYFAVCMGAGPGVVANTVLKDQWGRARPAQVVEFGGDATFSEPLIISSQCERNCSFVSGEAASIFMIFFAAAQLLQRYARALIAAGVAAGLAAGFVRMTQGAHFLSDVIFAGVFMALTAALIHLAFRAVAQAGCGSPHGGKSRTFWWQGKGAVDGSLLEGKRSYVDQRALGMTAFSVMARRWRVREQHIAPKSFPRSGAPEAKQVSEREERLEREAGQEVPNARAV